MSTTETIRRLTIEEVKAALDKTGLKLKQGVTLEGNFCCPIGAVGLVNDCIKLDNYSDPSPAPIETGEAIGLSAEYADGFIDAFDIYPKSICSNDSSFSYRSGYTDGHDIAAALLPPEATS